MLILDSITRNDLTAELRGIPVILNIDDRDLMYEADQESFVSARLAYTCAIARLYSSLTK